MTPPRRPPRSERERRIREAALDRTIAETFPASDPPSTIPDPADETLLQGETLEGEPNASRAPTR
ncbi:MAG TPA: hypothetical protein VJ788_03910 [Gemmatimonadota bacterium]|nr:hypothetical protein [Gemmatimonadota bacterium]